MVSMECSDGRGHCECAECQKLGGVSDRVFGLAILGFALTEACFFYGLVSGLLAFAL